MKSVDIFCCSSDSRLVGAFLANSEDCKNCWEDSNIQYVASATIQDNQSEVFFNLGTGRIEDKVRNKNCVPLKIGKIMNKPDQTKKKVKLHAYKIYPTFGDPVAVAVSDESQTVCLEISGVGTFDSEAYYIPDWCYNNNLSVETSIIEL